MGGQDKQGRSASTTPPEPPPSRAAEGKITKTPPEPRADRPHVTRRPSRRRRAFGLLPEPWAVDGCAVEGWNEGRDDRQDPSRQRDARAGFLSVRAAISEKKLTGWRGGGVAGWRGGGGDSEGFRFFAKNLPLTSPPPRLPVNNPTPDLSSLQPHRSCWRACLRRRGPRWAHLRLGAISRRPRWVRDGASTRTRTRGPSVPTRVSEPELWRLRDGPHLHVGG